MENPVHSAVLMVMNGFENQNADEADGKSKINCNHWLDSLICLCGRSRF